MNAKAYGLDALSVDQLLAGLDAKDPTIATASRAYWGPVLDEYSLPVHPFLSKDEVTSVVSACNEW